MRKSLSQISQIISVGSVDGVLTSAALIRLIGDENIGLVFCQAFTVDKVDVSKWEANRKVAFVDLAVNNRDRSMTINFVRRVLEAGHEIVAVIDEHSREDWLEIVGFVPNVGCYHTAPKEEERTRHMNSHDSFFDTCESCCTNSLPRQFVLIVEPQSQSEGTFKSSGAVLKAAIGEEADAHAIELMDAADAGDRMDFSTRFGGVVNKAVKSDIANDARRVYLARHFAANVEPDVTILGWMAEYDEILKNHEEIVAARSDLGDGIVRVVTTGKKVDMTTLMNGLYRGGAKVVVLEGEQFNKSVGYKTPIVSFGASDQKLDLLTPVKAVVSSASGFTSKVNVGPEHEAAALEAIRAALKA